MKDMLILLVVALASNYSLAGNSEYPAHLECKTGLCKDEIYKRAVRIYCTKEEKSNPTLKQINWGPYLLKLGGGCWCSCSQFR